VPRAIGEYFPVEISSFSTMKITTRPATEFETFAHDNATPLNDYNIAPVNRPIYLPFCTAPDAQPFFTAGLAFELLHKADPKKRHTVTLMLSRVDGTSEAEFHFVCGDTFLSGTSKDGKPAAEIRITKAIDEAGLRGNVAKKVRQLMTDCFGMFSEDSGCSFWREIQKDADGPGCKHVRGVLDWLVSNGTLTNTLAQIREHYAAALKRNKAKPVLKDGLAETLERFAGPKVKGKIPIKVEGPSQMGKTFEVRALAKLFAHCEESAGYEGMESLDFLGTHLHTGGSSVWVDGPVTRAFRKAASGVPTLLFVDELYRVPRRERSVFLTALTPDEGKYRLRTGRLVNLTDGVAEMEIIEAPVDGLAIIATTNSGDDYDVESADPAEEGRWLTIIHNPGEGWVEDKLKLHADKHGHSHDAVKRLMKFRSNCEKLRMDRQCKASPSLGLLGRALALAQKETDLYDTTMLFFPSLTGRTPQGGIIKEQVEALENALNDAFAA
jgi:AAA domain (dynein-related subfamily)